MYNATHFFSFFVTKQKKNKKGKKLELSTTSLYNTSVKTSKLFMNTTQHLKGFLGATCGEKLRVFSAGAQGEVTNCNKHCD